MAYKILGQQDPSAATWTTLYTVPADKETVVSSLTICNRDADTEATVRVALRPAAGVLSDEMYLYYDLVIPANETFIATVGLTLDETDDVRVYTDNATVSFGLHGNEQDE